MERGEAGNVDGMREEAPQMTGFFGRGSLVTVSARTGNDLKGYVCDQNENGLLLDSRDPSGDPTGLRVPALVEHRTGERREVGVSDYATGQQDYRR